MRILLILAFLVLTSGAQAQEVPLPGTPLDPLETAAAICIGPGVDLGDEDPFEVLRGMPQKSCQKACKEALKGCLKVLKAVNNCGVVFLTSAGKIAAPICQGLGGSKAECKTIRSAVRSEIDDWLNASQGYVMECIIEGAQCSDVCQPNA